MRIITLAIQNYSQWILGGAMVWFAIFEAADIVKNRSRSKNDTSVLVTRFQVCSVLALAAAGGWTIWISPRVWRSMDILLGIAVLAISIFVFYMQLVEKKTNQRFLRFGILSFLLPATFKLLAGNIADSIPADIIQIIAGVIGVIFFSIFVYNEDKEEKKKITPRSERLIPYGGEDID